eukprot:ANDGO_07772.mRNA.1 hypothetical protein
MSRPMLSVLCFVLLGSFAVPAFCATPSVAELMSIVCNRTACGGTGSSGSVVNFAERPIDCSGYLMSYADVSVDISTYLGTFSSSNTTVGLYSWSVGSVLARKRVVLAFNDAAYTSPYYAYFESASDASSFAYFSGAPLLKCAGSPSSDAPSSYLHWLSAALVATSSWLCT